MIFLKELKKNIIGFPCINQIDDYTNASHRIFVMTQFGIVTLFWYENTKRLVCKNKNFLEVLKKTDLATYL